MEAEIVRIRGEVRALRPLPQRLQAAVARETHQANVVKSATAAVLECMEALDGARAAEKQARLDHAAAAQELAEVQAALCALKRTPCTSTQRLGKRRQ